ncbi:transglycosylase [Pseudoxanthomonas sp. 3HH-4]|uniref:transglycosylase domain-containing protein n=1 Tax=Pseudoxanthomonas sp. 3HH-4 TaxID=1690214 RepID=UPI0011540CE0|nr:transglycosylase domain-containing protein [Pseudoxanthomonas sp. 3HH-4]TQM06868.1 transglycosylase [Pseudoxanthomonas sp. 3HH-4]
MSRVVRHTVHAVALLVGVPLAGLLTYDIVAVRPHVAGIQSLLASAEPQEASPPAFIRDLIDAGEGSPDAYGARLALAQVYGAEERNAVRRHARELLWQILLPLHLDESGMHGLVVSQAHNGVDAGLAVFAQREYGKSLDDLSPMEAARAVAVIKSPSHYLRDRQRLEARAEWMLERAGYLH